VLKQIGLDPNPVATLYLPAVTGVLDDHFENWFLSYEEPPLVAPAGFESVICLDQSQVWPPPPTAPVPGVHP
jgi:hypothetical protein